MGLMLDSSCQKQTKMPTTIGIIGTAGRGRDGVKMTKQLFDRMITEAERIITKQLKLEWDDITLVSGGAAWSGQENKLLFAPLATSGFNNLAVLFCRPCRRPPYSCTCLWDETILPV